MLRVRASLRCCLRTAPHHAGMPRLRHYAFWSV